MSKYESSRRPEISRDDLPHVTRLLSVFDRITFNSYGEIVALMTVDLPVIGKIVISLYDRENHIQIQRSDDDANNGIMGGIWSGYRYELDIDHDWEWGDKLDRDILVMKVKNVLRHKIIKELA